MNRENKNSMGLPDKEYRQLMAQYKQSIPGQISEIKNAIKNIRRERNKETLGALRFLIHKMGGTSGVYQYTKVSELCRAWESELVEKIEKFGEVEFNDVFFNQLETNIKSICKEFK